jgi:hypothetical protein
MTVRGAVVFALLVLAVLIVSAWASKGHDTE